MVLSQAVSLVKVVVVEVTAADFIPNLRGLLVPDLSQRALGTDRRSVEQGEEQPRQKHHNNNDNQKSDQLTRRTRPTLKFRAPSSRISAE
jgi:hypothetical protein